MIDYKKYGDRLVVGVSGGKDSTAVCLHLLENGFSKSDFDRVFIDTGWESPITYEYLNRLEGLIGSITRIKKEIPIPEEHKEFCLHIESLLGFESPFVRRLLKYLHFSRGNQKWCTGVLKVEPLREYFYQMEDEPINVVGIRKEESAKRSALEEWEYAKHFDCYVWRPIINWREQDVINIHHRFGLVPNPLYLSGNMPRVGCWPCINANKHSIANIDEDRIRIVEKLEKYVCEKTNRKASFFYYKTIREAIEWSKTSYGGKQYFLFDTTEPTCRKWGMCGV